MKFVKQVVIIEEDSESEEGLMSSSQSLVSIKFDSEFMLPSLDNFVFEG
jgi:hypothetical protein